MLSGGGLSSGNQSDRMLHETSQALFRRQFIFYFTLKIFIAFAGSPQIALAL